MTTPFSVYKSVPPVLASYHLKFVTAGLEAPISTDPLPQREPSIAVGAAGAETIVATTGTRGLVHPLAVYST